MSNRIKPMDQGLLGKVGGKIGDAGDASKISKDESAHGRGLTKPQHAGDTVKLTSGGKLLERLEKTLASLPEIDMARVDAVKAQIENGEYQIDAEKIAEALLRSDKELGE